MKQRDEIIIKLSVRFIQSIPIYLEGKGKEGQKKQRG